MTAFTIFAPATGSGRTAIAVIRVSGPASAESLATLTGLERPNPRELTRVRVRDATGEVLDDGLAVWFPGPRSATGEDVFELHLHGGQAVIDAVLSALGECAGLRPAEPGEFVRRAFDNGKLDLTAVEGIADLVAAETQAQRRQAVRQARGEFGARCETWRERLIRALAHLEASLDFADEDLPDDLASGVDAEAIEVHDAIRATLADGRWGQRLRDGFEVAVVGPPNVGKSTLVNTIARRDIAIVSETPGTTRDMIEVRVEIDGMPVTVIDTAGLRDAAGDIEAEGIRRTRARLAEADVVLVVKDVTTVSEEADVEDVDGGKVVVCNKIDAVGEVAGRARSGDILVSALTGEGIDNLLQTVGDTLKRQGIQSGEAGITRNRHRKELRECVTALTGITGAEAAETKAEHLRTAVRALGKVTGRVDVEDMLDVIFSEFCIGK